MRARSAFFAGVGSAAIVAIGWQAGVGTLVSDLPQSQASASGTTSGTTSSSAATPAPSASSSTATDSSTSTDATTTPSQSTTTTTGAADGTYDGSVVGTRYGNGQVQVVISGGKITDVIVLQRQQNDRKSEQISAQATPMLREEVLAAQSAKVSNIGGATYTSQSYLQSLQSALDAAGFTG